MCLVLSLLSAYRVLSAKEALSLSLFLFIYLFFPGNLSYIFVIQHFLTYDYFRSLLWVGPALLFSTATSVSILGWDGKVRTILSICMPNAGKY